MDSQFIPKAIDMVKDAIAADNNQDYETALGLYKKSLEYFMTGLKYETNPVSIPAEYPIYQRGGGSIDAV